MLSVMNKNAPSAEKHRTQIKKLLKNKQKKNCFSVNQVIS